MIRIRLQTGEDATISRYQAGRPQVRVEEENIAIHDVDYRRFRREGWEIGKRRLMLGKKIAHTCWERGSYSVLPGSAKVIGRPD